MKSLQLNWKFRDHHGVDFMGIIRAALVDIREGKIVKAEALSPSNLQRMPSLPMKNMDKKTSRTACAIHWNALYKDQILELYLNEVYFSGQAVCRWKRISRIFRQKRSLPEPA